MLSYIETIYLYIATVDFKKFKFKFFDFIYRDNAVIYPHGRAKKFKFKFFVSYMTTMWLHIIMVEAKRFNFKFFHHTSGQYTIIYIITVDAKKFKFKSFGIIYKIVMFFTESLVYKTQI